MRFEKKRIPLGTRALPHLKGLKKMFVGHIGDNQYTIFYSELKQCIHIRVHCGLNKVADWHDLQKIKDWLIGKEKIAVQVFPKASQLVDKGNTYHIFHWEGIEAPNLKELYT